MGKYPPSRLRAAFSEWHYKKLNSHSTGMDIDFIETKVENGLYVPIAVLEITRLGTKLTDQQLHIYLWVVKITKLPVYIVSTNESFSSFEVQDFPISYLSGNRNVMSEWDFIQWLDGLRNYKSSYRADDIDWDSIEKQFCSIRIEKSLQIPLTNIISRI